MLFDLQGKRRNVVRVAYALLAGLFVFGFVLFGVGSDVGAGLVDGILGRNGGGGSVDTLHSQNLENTKEELAEDPNNPELLLEAARLGFLHGAQLTSRDENDNMVSTAESDRVWNEALDHWDAYLKTDPDPPEVTVAGQMVFAARMMEDAVTAGQIQELVVAENPTDVGFRDLALFLYAQGRIEEGEAAAKEAIRLTSADEKEEAREWKKELHEESVKYQDALEAFQAANPDADTAPQLPNPFGSLGQQQAPGQLPPGFGS